MKAKILIIVFFITAFGACKKDIKTDNPISLDIPENLIGNWNWFYSSGGLAGGKYNPESTGENRRNECDADYSYRYYVNNILKASGKFYLTKERSIFSSDSAIVIRNLLAFPKSFKFVTSDTLILYEECFDCYTHHYNRIK